MNVLSSRLIEKSTDKTILDGNAVYHRDSFVVGVLHEKLILIVAAAPFYPFDYTSLYFDADKYPARQIIRDLKDGFGPEGDERYRAPSELHVDALDQIQPDNLEILYQDLETLERRLGCRSFTGNWERDFSRKKHLTSCLDGDRTYFRSAATSALDTGRCQVSSTVKGLLSREESSLIAFGFCIVALDSINPYSSGRRSSDFEKSEASLGASYV
jgi:hypothetical protein